MQRTRYWRLGLGNDPNTSTTDDAQQFRREGRPQAALAVPFAYGSGRPSRPTLGQHKERIKMGWGKIYEVPDSSRVLLATCSEKGEWYEALGTLGVENVPQFNAEDSISSWGAKLEEIKHPAAEFFVGELHAEDDDYDDPNVCFNGNSAVSTFVEHLNQAGKQFFVELFPSPIPNSAGESWLFEPLRNFLRGVSDRGNGVIILWES